MYFNLRILLLLRDLPVLKRHPILCSLAAILGLASGFLMPASAQPAEPIFSEATPEIRGWQPLVRVLDALTPNVDTSLALTPKNVTDKIGQLLDSGQNEAALDAINKRLQQRENNAEIGVDVQLLFLQGRAYSQLGQHPQAIESYKQLTIFYPELPEPWNNLAAEYMRLNQLDLAKEALDMALLANPNYRLALQNQGELQLMLAHRSFEKAKDPARAKDTQYLLPTN